MGKAHNILIGKLEGKRPFWRPKIEGKELLKSVLEYGLDCSGWGCDLTSGFSE
jgi:hypothetical protein